eukprot:scaffold926_cov248-Pinguiococcus_pyrenoidosus.AAC.13
MHSNAQPLRIHKVSSTPIGMSKEQTKLVLCPVGVEEAVTLGIARSRDSSTHSTISRLRTCGRQRASSLAGLVAGTCVAILRVILLHATRPEPDARHLIKELPRVRVADLEDFPIEAARLHEQAVHEHTILGDVGLLHLLRPERHHLASHDERVDGDRIVARVRLLHGRHEALGEEEARHPVAGTRPFSKPTTHELQSRQEILRPAGTGHHDEALDGLLNLLERRLDDGDQAVEAVKLLRQEHPHGVHGAGADGLEGLWVRRSHVELVSHALFEVLGNLAYDVVVTGTGGVLLAAAAAAAAAGRDDSVEQRLGLLVLEGDVRVVVQAEDLRRALRDASFLRSEVDAGLAEAVVVAEQLGREKGRENAGDGALVHLVGHPATVHHLGNDHVQGVPWQDLVLLRVHADHRHPGLEVAIHPAVRDVPSHGAELLALQDERVEEGQGEHQLLVRAGSRATAALVVGFFEVQEGALEVRPQTLGRLIGDLDARLQNRHRELEARNGRQPQAVVVIDGVRGGATGLHGLFQTAQPRHGQVAVLEADPVACRLPLLHEALGHGALALPKADDLHGVVHLHSRREVHQVVHHVCTGAQHKDERRHLAAVVVGSLEVEGRRLGERSSQTLAHVDSASEDGLLGSHNPQKQELLERRQLLSEAEGQRRQVGRRTGVGLLPRGGLLLNAGQHVGVPTAKEGLQLHQRCPWASFQPLVTFRRRMLRERLGAWRPRPDHEGPPLQVGNDAGSPIDVGRDEAGVEHLVLLEEAAADVGEHAPRDVVDEDAQALLQDLRLRGALQALVENLLVELEAVLVHRVQKRQVGDDEVDDAAARRHDAVLLARLVDLLLRGLGLREPLADVGGGHLRLPQRVDELLVVQDVARRGALRVGDAHHELVVLLLEVRALALDDVHKQLVLQAAGRDREVDDGGLDADLRHVVRIRQLGGHEEAEVVAVGDVAVPEMQQVLAVALEDLLEQHRLQRWVEGLFHVLQQDRRAVSDAHLQRPQEVLLRQLDDLQVPLGEHVADPSVRLSLRVDHERPASSHGGEHAVLGAEHVRGKLHELPLSNEHRLAQASLQAELGVHGNGQVHAAVHPGLRHAAAELRCEGPEHVAHEVHLVLRQALGRFRPSHRFSAEAAEQLLGANQLHLGVGRLMLQVRLLLLRCLQRGLQLGDAGQHGAEALLLLLELLLDRLELGLRLGQRLLLRLNHLGHAVIGHHGPYPHAEALGGHGHSTDLLGDELWIVHVLSELANHRRWDVVLVVGLELVHERHPTHELLGFLPRRLHAEEDAHGLHDDLHELRRLREGLELLDLFLVQRVQRLHSSVERWQGLVQVGLAVVLHRLDGRGDLVGLFDIRLDHRLLLVGLRLVHLHLGQQLFGVFGRLVEHGLHLRKLLLKVLHHDLGLCQLGEAAAVAALVRGHDIPLLAQLVEVQVDELQVRRRGGVVVTAQVLAVLHGLGLDGAVYAHGHAAQGIQIGLHAEGIRDGVVPLDLNRLQHEALRHAVERFLGPRVEPVDGRTVHKRGKVQQSIPEAAADR